MTTATLPPLRTHQGVLISPVSQARRILHRTLTRRALRSTILAHRTRLKTTGDIPLTEDLRRRHLVAPPGFRRLLLAVLPWALLAVHLPPIPAVLPQPGGLRRQAGDFLLTM